MMKINDPVDVRERFAFTHGWATLRAISDGTQINEVTITKALKGKPIQMKTVLRIAHALNASASEIATVAEN